MGPLRSRSTTSKIEFRVSRPEFLRLHDAHASVSPPPGFGPRVLIELGLALEVTFVIVLVFIVLITVVTVWMLQWLLCLRSRTHKPCSLRVTGSSSLHTLLSAGSS